MKTKALALALTAASVVALSDAQAGGAPPPADPKARAPKAAATGEPLQVAPAPHAPFLAPAAPAAAASPIAPAGKVEIGELSFDGGLVDRGADLKHEFSLKNVGQNDLTVDAKPGCGCTVTEFDKVIAPGKSGKVVATVHTTNFKGPISKSITVTTNDPENARFTLTMKANVAVPLDVQPSENVSFTGKSEELTPQRLTLASSDESAFDVLSVTPSDSNFRISVVAAPGTGSAPKPKAGTVASGSNRYELTVTPSPNLPVGRLNATVTLKTSHPKAPEQAIRIFGTITGEVDVTPPYVTLVAGPGASPEQRVQHVAIKKPTGEPLELKGVTSDNLGFATTITTVTKGREYDLEVRYTGAPLTAPVSGKIQVKTNDPRQPTLELQAWARSDDAGRPSSVAGAPVTLRPPHVAKAPPTP